LHDKRYPGTPDLVLPKYKTVLLVHGCFWHGHENCRAAGIPESNREFWESKLERNKERDLAVLKKLEESGWKVITIWECDVKSLRKRQIRFERLIAEILGSSRKVK
jgi:DNA mismatch endonuclease (patch repair protein)